MKQIDRAREELLGHKILWAEANARILIRYPSIVEEEAKLLSDLQEAEERVEALLRQWWAQGCREVVTSASELEAMLTSFGNVKVDLGAMRVDGDTARAEAKRLKALILGARVMNEAQCVAADVLAARDAAEKERDDWKAKFESREKDYTQECVENARLKRVHAQNTQGLQCEIARLKYAEKELDETNKKIARTVREALKILTAPGCMIVEHDRALDLLAKAVGVEPSPARFGSGPREPFKVSPVEPLQLATRTWVEKRIDEKIKAYANDPNAVFVGKLRCK